MAKYYCFDRYVLYNMGKPVYSCNTERGMVNHIRKNHLGFISLDDGVGIIDKNTFPYSEIVNRMYKVYGLGTIYVVRNWDLPRGVFINRADKGVDLMRKVTGHDDDGNYTEYEVKDYVNLGHFANIDKAIDYCHSKYGVDPDRDLWIYTK